MSYFLVILLFKSLKQHLPGGRGSCGPASPTHRSAQEGLLRRQGGDSEASKVRRLSHHHGHHDYPHHPHHLQARPPMQHHNHSNQDRLPRDEKRGGCYCCQVELWFSSYEVLNKNHHLNDHVCCTLLWPIMIRKHCCKVFINLLGYKEPNLVHLARCKVSQICLNQCLHYHENHHPSIIELKKAWFM